jgi:hypothetical protein
MSVKGTHRLRAARKTVRQAWGWLGLRQAQILLPLEAFVAARPPAAFPPDYDDLWYLYHTVLRQRPRTVLEVGSGCSTLVLALALQHVGTPAQMVSLDNHAGWAEQTRKALPYPVWHWCHVTTSDLVPDVVRGLRGYQYAARPPALVPDLVYVDGPGSLTPAQAAALDGLCALDLLVLEPSLPVGCRVIVDGRPGTTAFLRAHFQRSWQFRRYDASDRHVFTLRETPKHEG